MVEPVPAGRPLARAARNMLADLGRKGARLWARAVSGAVWTLARADGSRTEIPAAFVAVAVARGWLVLEDQPAGERRARLTPAGRKAAGLSAERQRTRLRGPDGADAEVELNLAESPLAWLARRRDADGNPFLDAGQVAAGERLRADFERARLRARLTADWTLPVSGARRGPVAGPEALHEVARAARRRVDAALAAVGTGLSDVLVLVCCHLKGLEAAEVALRWPPRTARVVLAIGLTRLAEHYGLRGSAPSGRIRAWQAEAGGEAEPAG